MRAFKASVFTFLSVSPGRYLATVENTSVFAMLAAVFIIDALSSGDLLSYPAKSSLTILSRFILTRHAVIRAVWLASALADFSRRVFAVSGDFIETMYEATFATYPP